MTGKEPMKARALSALSISLVVLSIAVLALLFTLALRAASRGAPTAQNSPDRSSPFGTSTQLWLSAANSLSNNGLSGTVHGTAPGSPYFLLSRPSPAATNGWTVEQLLIGSAGRQTPFLLPYSNRPDSLFLTVRSWSSNDEI